MKVYFFSFDLVLSLVAVLIVLGGFKGGGRGVLFIGPWFLPPWAELADPSPVFVENLSPWLDSRPPDLGVLAGKAEILGRSPPPLPFGTWVPDGSLAGKLVAAFYAGRRLLVSSSELSSLKVLLLLIVSNLFYSHRCCNQIIWSCRLHSRLSIRDCGFIFAFWSSLWWRRCFIWRRCNSRNWIFWSDFI